MLTNKRCTIKSAKLLVLVCVLTHYAILLRRQSVIGSLCIGHRGNTRPVAAYGDRTLAMNRAMKSGRHIATNTVDFLEKNYPHQ